MKYSLEQEHQVCIHCKYVMGQLCDTYHSIDYVNISISGSVEVHTTSGRSYLADFSKFEFHPFVGQSIKYIIDTIKPTEEITIFVGDELSIHISQFTIWEI